MYRMLMAVACSWAMFAGAPSLVVAEEGASAEAPVAAATLTETADETPAATVAPIAEASAVVAPIVDTPATVTPVAASADVSEATPLLATPAVVEQPAQSQVEVALADPPTATEAAKEARPARRGMSGARHRHGDAAHGKDGSAHRRPGHLADAGRDHGRHVRGHRGHHDRHAKSHRSYGRHAGRHHGGGHRNHGRHARGHRGQHRRHAWGHGGNIGRTHRFWGAQVPGKSIRLGGWSSGGFMGRLDTNRDTKISREEFNQLFAKVDTNNDGEVTREEIFAQFRLARADGTSKSKTTEQPTVPEQAKVATPPVAEPAKTEPAKTENPPVAEPAKSDAPKSPPNFGGRRFGRGLGFGPKGPPSVDSIFERSDKNKDGKLTKDEMPEFIWNGMLSSDTDKDGAITKAELEERFKHAKERSRP